MAQLDREFGGKGSGAGAFGKVVKLAFDQDDSIYVSDKDNKMIQKLDSEGNFLMQVPQAGNEEPRFNAPGHIAVDGQVALMVPVDSKVSTFYRIAKTECPSFGLSERLIDKHHGVCSEVTFEVLKFLNDPVS